MCRTVESHDVHHFHDLYVKGYPCILCVCIWPFARGLRFSFPLLLGAKGRNPKHNYFSTQKIRFYTSVCIDHGSFCCIENRREIAQKMKNSTRKLEFYNWAPYILTHGMWKRKVNSQSWRQRAVTLCARLHQPPNLVYLCVIWRELPPGYFPLALCMAYVHFLSAGKYITRFLKSISIF